MLQLVWGERLERGCQFQLSRTLGFDIHVGARGRNWGLLKSLTAEHTVKVLERPQPQEEVSQGNPHAAAEVTWNSVLVSHCVKKIKFILRICNHGPANHAGLGPKLYCLNLRGNLIIFPPSKRPQEHHWSEEKWSAQGLLLVMLTAQVTNRSSSRKISTYSTISNLFFSTSQIFFFLQDTFIFQSLNKRFEFLFHFHL